MKAWERESEKYRNARPADFESDPSDWSGIDVVLAARKAQLKLFWDSRVPGSRAPESLYTAMVQARYNRGYDVSEAESLLDGAMEALETEDIAALERISGRILKSLEDAPVDPDHPTHATARPEGWNAIRGRMAAAAVPGDGDEPPTPADIPGLRRKILGGWQGQIAGGSYGTALEGYAGETLRAVYGDRLDGYVKPPETLNDDITFELAVLKAAEKAAARHSAGGPVLSAEDIADMWLQYIPFGWSAEHFALENLRRGWYPPESGRRGNPFSEWIGAQMRTMVCGYLAPGDPMRAAEYAWMDSSVSHETNGIYAGIHSAVLSSLAFVIDDTRVLLTESRKYVPEDSEFALLMDRAMDRAAASKDHITAWESMAGDLRTYNWIHAYPNMVAVVLALWFCGDDISRAFRILGECGADVDCNAGETGSALGIMHTVPSRWIEPFGDVLETYVPGMERMTISGLADWTADIARALA